jgi:hypothetical protein
MQHLLNSCQKLIPFLSSSGAHWVNALHTTQKTHSVNPSIMTQWAKSNTNVACGTERTRHNKSQFKPGVCGSCSWQEEDINLHWGQASLLLNMYWGFFQWDHKAAGGVRLDHSFPSSTKAKNDKLADLTPTFTCKMPT